MWLRKALRVLAGFELHPRQTLGALAALPRFVRDYRGFWSRCDWERDLQPCLLDRDASAGSLGEYFWQDLLVARRIIESDPERHVDVGSRLDGFIAHLACVRPVEVYDIRPLTAAIPNVRFTQWDLTAPGPAAPGEQADCVSCLHTLEHVGLGRYGDPIDPEGWRRGLSRLASLVAPGGRLWLSVPVGRRRVVFNAHRVFDARELLDQARREDLVAVEFGVLEPGGCFAPLGGDAALDSLARREYALGLFVFARAPVVRPD